MTYKLFSSFDYSSFFCIKMFYIFLFVGLFVCYFVFSSYVSLMYYMFKSLYNILNYNMGVLGLFKLCFFCFGFLLLLFNLVGLVPYLYSISSQFFFVFMYSLMVWLVIVSSSFIFSPMVFLSGLTPTGAPLFLVVLLKYIESVSMLVRPLTLALRLSIKITTGHIFIILITMFISSYSFLFVGLFILYLFFELFVGFIQSFVFVLLLSQYTLEHS